MTSCLVKCVNCEVQRKQLLRQQWRHALLKAYTNRGLIQTDVLSVSLRSVLSFTGNIKGRINKTDRSLTHQNAVKH